MKLNTMQAGSRVYVSGYSPFRGLTGTIQQVDVVNEIDEYQCFYLVKLEKAYMRESIWFLDDEVEANSMRDLLL